MRLFVKAFSYSSILIVVFLSFFESPALCQKSKSSGLLSPKEINPLAEESTAFLDDDLHRYWSLAESAYQKKQYWEAAQYFLFMLRHRFDDPLLLYNLARCYGQLGEARLASKYVTKAVDAGFIDIAQIGRDTSFDRVRRDQHFIELQQWLDKYGNLLGSTFYIRSVSLKPCRIQVPRRVEAGRKYPLVLGLHGRGGSATEFIALWEFMGDHQVIFAALEAPYQFHPSFFSKKLQYSWRIPVDDQTVWKESNPLVIEYIAEAAQSIARLYPVGDIYLLGFSQGGTYAYEAAMRHPVIFRGMIIFGSAYPGALMLTEEDQKKAAGKVRVYIAHGRSDPGIPAERGVQAKETLIQRGFDVTYQEFNGGHEVDAKTLRQALEWIKAAK